MSVDRPFSSPATLPSTLEVPWTNTMRHGMGYNGTTSQLTGCAVESMLLCPPNSDPTVNVTLRSLRSQEDVQRHIGAAIQASASVFGIGAKAAYDQARSIQFSDTAMTMILECHIRQAPASYSVLPTLTRAAKQLFQSMSKLSPQLMGTISLQDKSASRVFLRS